MQTSILARVILVAEDNLKLKHVAVVKGGMPNDNYWVFPGTEIQADETEERAAKRAALKTFGIDVDIGPMLARISLVESDKTRIETFYLAYSRSADEIDITIGGKGELFSVNLLLNYDIRPKEIQDYICKKFPAHTQIDAHRKICDEITSVGLRELGDAERRIESNETAALKERGDLNLLMFGIIGAVLTFNKESLNSPFVVLGIAMLVSMAVVSYINIRRKRDVRIYNTSLFRSEMERLFRNCLNSFNNHAASLNSYTEQGWQKSVVEFKTWDPSKLQMKKEKRQEVEDRYFTWVVVGIGFIGTGLLTLSNYNWGNVLKAAFDLLALIFY